MGEVPTRKHTKWRNRTSDRESDGRFWIEKPSSVSYSSFLVGLTIGLSRLVSETFACDRETDRRTDGRTTLTITIAGLHIVAGQLISQKITRWISKHYVRHWRIAVLSETLAYKNIHKINKLNILATILRTVAIDIFGVRQSVCVAASRHGWTDRGPA